jgi:hypothetical protein
MVFVSIINISAFKILTSSKRYVKLFGMEHVLIYNSFDFFIMFDRSSYLKLLLKRKNQSYAKSILYTKQY